MSDLQVDIVHIGRNLYSIHRNDRESMEEEYMKVYQRRIDPNVQASDIYVLKRYKVWVSEENCDVLGMFNAPSQRMLPHINCPVDVTHYNEGTLLEVLGYDPAKRYLKYSMNGVTPRVLRDDEKQQTLHQTLRHHGLNRLHICYKI